MKLSNYQIITLSHSKPCLVSFSSTGRENYNQKLLRLIDSAQQHWQGDYLIYSPDHWLNEYKGVTIHKGLPQPKLVASLPHSEMPYQFKVALIQQAFEMGYKKIAWLDSSMIIQKDLSPLFETPTGITVFYNLGHPLKNYISDNACKLLKVSEKKLETIPQIWGGALFFNFEKKNARDVFEKIKQFSLSGAFKDGTSTRPGFKAHRHDQAVISVLVHQKCNMLPYGKIVCPPHHTTGEYGNDYYLICK